MHEQQQRERLKPPATPPAAAPALERPPPGLQLRAAGMTSAQAPMSVPAPEPGAPIAAALPPLTEDQRALLRQAIPGAALLEFVEERDRKIQLLRTLQSERSALVVAGVPEPSTPEGDRAAQLDIDIGGLERGIEELDSAVGAFRKALHVDSDAALVALVTERFPELFVERARQIALDELDQNDALVEAEQKRYAPGSGDPFDVHALRDAAQHLSWMNKQADAVRARLTLARSAAPTLPGGLPEPDQVSSSEVDVESARAELEKWHTDIDTQRQHYALEFPVLLRPLDFDAMASASDEELSALVGGELTSIRENIQTTKDNLGTSLKVWDLVGIREKTFQDLGVAPDSPLRQAVESRMQNERSNEELLGLAISALSITAGIVAAAATGGLALFAGGVALGASGFQLGRSVESYLAEKAASDVALDPSRADFSLGDPDALAVLLDLLAVGVDAVLVARLAKALARVRPVGGRVNVGGGTPPLDPFAANASNLNPGIQGSGGPPLEAIPNLIRAYAHEIAEVVVNRSADQILMRKVFYADVRWEEFARGAADVAKPNSLLFINTWVYGNAAEQAAAAQRLVAAFESAGFQNVRLMGAGAETVVMGRGPTRLFSLTLTGQGPVAGAHVGAAAAEAIERAETEHGR